MVSMMLIQTIVVNFDEVKQARDDDAKKKLRMLNVYGQYNRR